MANRDAGRNRQVSATEDQGRARAAGSRKPGVMGRMMEQCKETVEAIRLPRPDWRTFAWGLLLLILVIFIVRNWAPLRINFFGWYLDAPRAVVFAVFFVLGMVTTWLIEVSHRRARAAQATAEEEAATEADSVQGYVWDEDVEEEDMAATEIPPGEFEPAPEEFAEGPVKKADAGSDIEDVEPEDEDDDPILAADETEGDALSEEFSFETPAYDEEEQIGEDIEESGSDDEGDDSRSPFGRM